MLGTSTMPAVEEKMLDMILAHFSTKIWFAFGVGLFLGTFFGVWLIGLSCGKFGGKEYRGNTDNGKY